MDGTRHAGRPPQMPQVRQQ